MGQLRDSLSTAVPAAQMETLARLLGDTPEATARALAAAVPALLGILSNRASRGGMDEVMALAGPLLAHGDPLDRFTAALADSSVRTGLMEEGHALATHLLGPNEGPMAAALTQATGTRAHTVAEVLKLAGPIGLGAAARLLGGDVTADRLAALLEAERPALLAGLPPELGPLVAASAAEQSPLHGTPVEGAAGAAASAGRWLPWLAAAVVAIIIATSVRTFDSGSPAPAQKAGTTPIITQAPVVLGRAELPDGSVLMLPEGSAALEIARALAGGDAAGGQRRFRLGELGYSATEDRLDAAGEEAVRAVASVLKAWPTARVRIEGHGDGTGDPAVSLAETAARARAVAALLGAEGVAEARIEARGVGGAEPIATTQTAEGRAQNRRTMVIITTT